MQQQRLNRLDAFTAWFAPRFTARRVAARVRLEMGADLRQRFYEAAGSGRRTQGWVKTSGDANAQTIGYIAQTRNVARDLIRNNAYAESAVASIVDHTVGWGIVAKPAKGTPQTVADRLMAQWRAWAESTACDAEGRLDLAGIQKLVVRAMVESGEVMVRRRWRRPEDNLPIPLQLQVLEPDYLDTLKDGALPGGGRIIGGIEFDGIGRRVAYHLFREHPGSMVSGANFGESNRIPAREVLHIFKQSRPGQSRGISWFAPVITRLKDFDEYEDAALMKQKIAACLTVLTTDVDGSSSQLGGADSTDDTLDLLGPGWIGNLPPGKEVHVVNPPRVDEHASYSATVLRAIASGLGMTYEDLTGDYTGLPYSAARMSRIRHWARVEDWRWRTVIPQFCEPVWAWAQEAMAVMNRLGDAPYIAAEWTAPPPPMLEPDTEMRAYMAGMRIGAITWPDMVRERGYDPEDQLLEIAEWNKKFDAAGIILDSDPRRTTQQGFSPSSDNPTPPPKKAAAPPTPAASTETQSLTPERMVDRAFSALEIALGQAHQVNISEGAVQISTAAAPAPSVTMEAPVVNVTTPPVTVEGATVTVSPADVIIADGAIRIDAPVTVAATPVPDVFVEAPVVNVAPAEVAVTIEEGAVRVDVPPQRPMAKTVTRDEAGRITDIVERPADEEEPPA